jgi:hypothetical protein
LSGFGVVRQKMLHQIRAVAAELLQLHISYRIPQQY